MTTESAAVWAIDMGNNSLKAIRLTDAGGILKVTGFANIEHSKILTSSDVDEIEKDELIALSLRRFVQENDVGKEDIILSVPSHSSFVRFVNLPPVEKKRIPEIIKFEATQQIPFDINEVQWDWQLMADDERREKPVGIFAIKNEIINSALEYFSRENLKVTCVQMASMALYNYVWYDLDLGKSSNRGVVALDIGAENTDLVVCTGKTVWQRCVPIGGNAFTRAISQTFKVSFKKAEKLKRTAAVSKYARQIFQAMMPVFSDLASEIQRSIGFYKNSNPEVKLKMVVALGGCTKLRGLLKYLQQSLQLPVERFDAFKKLTIGENVSAAKFHDSVNDLGIVYGLALQGLGLGRIESNLLPKDIARSMAWASKMKYFVAAACVLLVVSLMSFGRTYLDKVRYDNYRSVRTQVKNITTQAEQAISNLQQQESKSSGYETIISKQFDLFEYRDVITLLYQTIIRSLPNERNNPEQNGLYKAFAAGDVETVLDTPRKERRQLFITGISIRFTDNLEEAQFEKSSYSGYAASTQPRLSGSAYDTKSSRLAVAEAADGSGGSKPAQQGQIQEKLNMGFLVTIEGYSPYKDIEELLEPIDVGKDKRRWGFITRLNNLDDIVDGNSPFMLYDKSNKKHFEKITGDVVLNSTQMPAGIGITSEVIVNEQQGKIENVLIDPMTKEIINKRTVMDEFGRNKVDMYGRPIYEKNDSWFALNVKFIWRDAPKDIVEPAAQSKGYSSQF